MGLPQFSEREKENKMNVSKSKVVMLGICCMMIMVMISVSSASATVSDPCTNTWHHGSLAAVTTPGEEPNVFTLTFVIPGFGSNFLDNCFIPGRCSLWVCNADPTASMSDYSCTDVPVGSCIAFLVNECTTGTPTIVKLESFVRPGSPCVE